MTAAKTQYAYGTQTSIQIEAIWCNGCGIPYGLPKGFLKQRREDHQTWTCPNGCRRHFSEGSSEAEKRAAQAEQELTAARSLAQREARRRADAEDAARRADYQARAAKGQLTKARKRAAAGVCPWCQRTFQNVARHMAGQHPDYPEPSGQ